MTAAQAVRFVLHTGDVQVRTPELVTVVSPAGPVVQFVRLLEGDWAAHAPSTGWTVDLDAEAGDLLDEFVVEVRHLEAAS